MAGCILSTRVGLYTANRGATHRDQIGPMNITRGGGEALNAMKYFLFKGRCQHSSVTSGNFLQRMTNVG